MIGLQKTIALVDDSVDRNHNQIGRSSLDTLVDLFVTYYYTVATLVDLFGKI